MQQTLHSAIDALFNFPQLQLVFICFMMLVFAVAVWRMQRRINEDIRRREEGDRQLLNALQRITRLEDQLANSPATATFERTLDHADLKNRLQAPVTSGNAPNKYRHVSALAEQGMTEQQIAEVLNISVAEASQLISLSRIACSE